MACALLVEILMSSAAALPLLSSVRPESSPLPRAVLSRPRHVPLASLGLANHLLASPLLADDASEEAPSSAGPISDTVISERVARLPQPVPLTPSVAALHAAGASEPANAVHPDDAGGLA